MDVNYMIPLQGEMGPVRPTPKLNQHPSLTAVNTAKRASLIQESVVDIF
jgi:hypothetical protein